MTQNNKTKHSNEYIQKVHNDRRKGKKYFNGKTYIYFLINSDPQLHDELSKHNHVNKQIGLLIAIYYMNRNILYQTERTKSIQITRITIKFRKKKTKTVGNIIPKERSTYNFKKILTQYHLILQVVIVIKSIPIVLLNFIYPIKS